MLAAALLAAPSAWAIDCRKASTSTEKAVCADDKLKGLDWQLNRDYRAFVKHHRATGHYNCLLEDEAERQKQWLLQRDACGGDAPCIQKANQDRLAALSMYTRACFPSDSSEKYTGRSCYKPFGPTAPVTSGASPTAPTASTNCAQGDRVTYAFIKQAEGDMFEVYVPGAFKANTGTGLNEGPRMCKQKDKNGKVIKDKKGKVVLEQCPAVQNSGITIGQGVDLGQQSESSLRRYMQIEEKKYGKPAGVGIDDILSEIPSNFYGVHKGKAVTVLNGYYESNNHRYLKLSADESHFLSSAVQHGYAEDSAAMFKKNSKLDFWSLPAAVQTTFTDMKYNAYIRVVAAHYYKGEWQQAADKWKAMGTDQKYPEWKRSRFLKRADMLRAAIDEGTLPKNGEPCVPKKQGVAFNEQFSWRKRQFLFWA